jgi:SH3-like domain-containing protein/tetratricopeptide (TPR) repeat protein
MLRPDPGAMRLFRGINPLWRRQRNERFFSGRTFSLWRMFLLLGAGLLLLARAAVGGPALRIDRLQVNVRADATVQSGLVAVLAAGEEVEQLGEKDEWRRIRMTDGREGWVHSNLVQERLIVTGNGVRIRAAGSTAAPAVTMASAGDELGRLGGRGNWIEVSLADGKRGWIWNRLVRSKEIAISPAPASTTSLPPTGGEVFVIEVEATAPPAAAAAVEAPELEPAEEPPAEEVIDLAIDPEAVRSNPYIEGLQQELERDFQAALASFEKVLEKDPLHLNGLLHAARAHKQLNEYTLARQKLYRALELGTRRREIFKELGDVYRLNGEPDSAQKYQALFKGEEWSPQAGDAGEKEGGEESGWPISDVLWIYALVVVATSVLLAVLILLLRRQKGTGQKEPATDKGKFAQAMRDTGDRPTAAGAGEEAELDRQIVEKRAELRASAGAFLDAGGMEKEEEAGLEEQHLEQILGQLEGLRNALEMQDERARIYADVLRLQDMKIEVMAQELQMRRRRGKG